MAFSSSGRYGATQELTTGAASVASAAFAVQTYQIRVACTSACRIRIGDGTPTAVATDTLLPANWVDVITVSPGQKIAAIQDVAGGKLTVTELV